MNKVFKFQIILDDTVKYEGEAVVGDAFPVPPSGTTIDITLFNKATKTIQKGHMIYA